MSCFCSYGLAAQARGINEMRGEVIKSKALRKKDLRLPDHKNGRSLVILEEGGQGVQERLIKMRSCNIVGESEV